MLNKHQAQLSHSQVMKIMCLKNMSLYKLELLKRDFTYQTIEGLIGLIATFDDCQELSSLIYQDMQRNSFFRNRCRATFSYLGLIQRKNNLYLYSTVKSRQKTLGYSGKVESQYMITYFHQIFQDFSYKDLIQSHISIMFTFLPDDYYWGRKQV
ncbi:Hypothetical_protein [Hexamita inflata]|uniref:Hypothetical_protein n=1 Tax=Hexamita inflata TaxID=28002 RepID=A0AA86U8J2_9EUKA|nr:Hypothetical protein HINF_LOCUS35100 [Hexamita inflata]